MIALILAALPSLPAPQAPAEARRNARDAQDAQDAREVRETQDAREARDAGDAGEPTDRTPAQRAEAELSRIEAELVTALAARAPWIAAERGLEPPAGAGLAATGVAAAQVHDRALAKAEADLVRVAAADLSPLRAADRAWVAAWIRAERSLAAGLAPERTDPGTALREVEAALAAALPLGRWAPPPSPEWAPDDAPGLVADELRPLREVLAQIPERLAAGRREATFPCPVRARLAAAETVQVEALLERPPGLDAGAAADLEGELRAASAAVRGYRVWCLGAAGDGEPRRLGEREWEAVVGALTGAEASERAVAPRLLREVARLADAGGVPPPAAPAGELEPDALAAALEEEAERGRAFAGAEGLAAAERHLAPVEVRVAAPLARGAPAAVLEAGRPGGAPVLVVAPGGRGWPAGLTAARRVQLAAPGRTAAALRRGYPGEALWLSWTRAAVRPAQRHIWNRAAREGFGLYALERSTRGGESPRGADPALREEVDRVLLREAARCLASLEVHASGLPLSRVDEEFAKRTGFPPEAARYEVRKALVDPLHGIGALVYLELAELERRTAGDLPQASAWKEVARALAGLPSARAADVLALREGRTR